MGKAIAELYAKEGAKVVVSDFNYEGAKAVAKAIEEKGGAAIANRTNVAESADLEQLFAETKGAFGKLDILVNNAGIMDGMEPVGISRMRNGIAYLLLTLLVLCVQCVLLRISSWNKAMA